VPVAIVAISGERKRLYSGSSGHEYTRWLIPSSSSNGKQTMRKKRLSLSCGLVLLSTCFSTIAGQRSIRTYPKNADDVVALAETLSRVDYSVNDAIKHSDKDFLAVKSIHFKRIWRSEANAAKPGTKGV
jgi:hypothetical protein